MLRKKQQVKGVTKQCFDCDMVTQQFPAPEDEMSRVNAGPKMSQLSQGPDLNWKKPAISNVGRISGRILHHVSTLSTIWVYF